MTTIQTLSDQAPLILSLSAELGLRAPSSITGIPGEPTQTFTYEPDLSLAEQAIAGRIRALLRSAVRVTSAEWEALEPDIDGLRTYHGLATPTAAQTALATKAIIRVLRALLRD